MIALRVSENETTTTLASSGDAMVDGKDGPGEHRDDAVAETDCCEGRERGGAGSTPLISASHIRALRCCMGAGHRGSTATAVDQTGQ